MVIVVTGQITVPSPSYVTDGITVSIATSASIDPTCGQRFCLDSTSLEGLTVVTAPGSNDQFFIRSNFFPTPNATVFQECSLHSGKPCDNVLQSNQNFELTVAISSGDTLTTTFCNSSDNCQIASFRNNLGFSLTELGELMTFAIGANNEQPTDHSAVFIDSVDVYSTIQCNPSCVHGICFSKNQCYCQPGWTGQFCDMGKSCQCP